MRDRRDILGDLDGFVAMLLLCRFNTRERAPEVGSRTFRLRRVMLTNIVSPFLLSAMFSKYLISNFVTTGISLHVPSLPENRTLLAATDFAAGKGTDMPWADKKTAGKGCTAGKGPNKPSANNGPRQIEAYGEECLHVGPCAGLRAIILKNLNFNF